MQNTGTPCGTRGGWCGTQKRRCGTDDAVWNTGGWCGTQERRCGTRGAALTEAVNFAARLTSQRSFDEQNNHKADCVGVWTLIRSVLCIRGDPARDCVESSVRCKVFSENRSAPTIREAFMRVKIEFEQNHVGVSVVVLEGGVVLGDVRVEVQGECGEDGEDEEGRKKLGRRYFFW